MFWQEIAYTLFNPWRAGIVEEPLSSYQFSNINEWISCEGEEAETSEFCFVSNIPPDEWRQFINNRQRYCMNKLSKENITVESVTLSKLIEKIHILVLSELIIKR